MSTFDLTTMMSGAGGAYSRKQIDRFADSDCQLHRLPDGLETRVNAEGRVVFADYPSGHQVRIHARTTVVLAAGSLDHWFSSKTDSDSRFWCRLD